MTRSRSVNTPETFALVGRFPVVADIGHRNCWNMK
jgi:hypothetical protein